MSAFDELGLGATGQFPHGRLSADDGGELRAGLVAVPEKGVLVLHFGKRVAWVALTADLADGLADALRGKAAELRAAAKPP